MMVARAGVGRLYLADGDVFGPPTSIANFWPPAKPWARARPWSPPDIFRRSTQPSWLRPSRNSWTQTASAISCPRSRLSWTPWIPWTARHDVVDAAQQAGVPVVHGAVSGDLRPGDHHYAPGPQGF